MAESNFLDGSFGKLSVTAAERRQRIGVVFDAIAPRYDLMNDLMSFGIHRLWKRKLARRVADVSGIAIDLAGGTGDVARLLVDGRRQVVVCDPSLPMMRAGKVRGSDRLTWLAGEAERLPFADASVDLLTVAFGLRNTTHLAQALAEIRRVLKPGACFVCLEFSRPSAWLAPFYDLYSFLVIPRLGALVAREPLAYQYLVESIRRFPDQAEFARLMEQSDFGTVHWENVSFGIACLHFGTRPHET
ncbi:MAG: class I SAM-dependent methyltransferase [Betaproteobacteria bacterium]|nr:class I SAM-dependent methyltransferase [Betaproteobacteria bacterium]